MDAKFYDIMWDNLSIKQNAHLLVNIQICFLGGDYACLAITKFFIYSICF